MLFVLWLSILSLVFRYQFYLYYLDIKSNIIRCTLIISIEVGLNKGASMIWGQWDLNPRPPAPQANTSMKLYQSTEMVSLTKLDDGPLRLTQRQCFLNVVLFIIKSNLDKNKDNKFHLDSG
jgi:hypothetical protein